MKYKKYPQYKDSGVEWLGKIPNNWLITKLKYKVPYQVGWTPPTKVPENFDGKNKWVTIADLNNRVINTTKSCISDAAAEQASMNITPKGSLLFSFKLSVGTVAFAGENLYTNEAIASFLKNENSNIHYLYYASPLFIVKNASENIYGAKILNQELISNATLVLPPLQEQQTIANYLDKATAKIDTLIEKQTKLIELLKEKRQSLVDKIIHHEITQNQRLGYVVEKVLRPVQRKVDEEYEALGLYNRGRGLFHKPLKSEDELGDSDFYWVEENDLILSGQFAWEGSVALATKNENNCIVSHRYPILRGKENLIDTEYLWAYFTTKEGDFILNEHSVGSAGRNRPLNINTLLKEKIPVPPIEAQKEVAKIVQAEQKIKVLVDRSIELLKEKKAALISAVVTGKIDVREAL